MAEAVSKEVPGQGNHLRMCPHCIEETESLTVQLFKKKKIGLADQHQSDQPSQPALLGFEENLGFPV